MSIPSLVYTWLFIRNDDQIRITRPSALQLVVSSMSMSMSAEERTYDFDTPVALLEFQLEFEAQLIKTGWHLEAFSPERRTGNDRRQLPRSGESDRRRTVH